MANLAIIKNDERFVLYSFTTGTVPVTPPQRRMTDDDALAYAMYLCRRGRIEEAERFLDRYCR
jgi:hypothetical protein